MPRLVDTPASTSSATILAWLARADPRQPHPFVGSTEHSYRPEQQQAAEHGRRSGKAPPRGRVHGDIIGHKGDLRYAGDHMADRALSVEAEGRRFDPAPDHISRPGQSAAGLQKCDYEDLLVGAISARWSTRPRTRTGCRHPLVCRTAAAGGSSVGKCSGPLVVPLRAGGGRAEAIRSRAWMFVGCADQRCCAALWPGQVACRSGTFMRGVWHRDRASADMPTRTLTGGPSSRADLVGSPIPVLEIRDTH